MAAISKSDKLLVIVESPSKAKHIKKFLHDAGYTNANVLASVGHIMHLADDRKSYKNSGVYVENNFELNLKISDDKAKVMAALKDGVKWADKVVLMSDPDREGFVIAWSLIKFLKIPKNKYFRAVTHEITQNAVIKAIENPIEMDNNIVDAGLARMTVDKMIGYSLSPIAKNYVGARSVGRCQSVGMKLIADREKEILNFVPDIYYDLYVSFEKNGVRLKAKYIGTDDNKLNHIADKNQVKVVQYECSSGDYIVKNILKKEKHDPPKPPFCTATLQQECGNKLGLKVKDTMSICQKLFESGLITYMRTDSTYMSKEFVSSLKKYVNNNYNNLFVEPRLAKKGAAEQDGHECCRVTDVELTPEKALAKISNDLQYKVYKLIWQRSVASAMPDAIISETTYYIYNGIHKFALVSNEMRDAGYKCIYSYADDDSRNDYIHESFCENETLKECLLTSEEKKTLPPPRFTESTLVKKLQDLGIGRPSTYATIVETVLSESRGYATLEDKKIVPTERGIQLSSYLDRAFPDIINLNYTSNLEENLDKIAEGKLSRFEFLTDFTLALEDSINKNKEIGLVTNKKEKVCQKCGAVLVVKRSRFGKLFLACPNYPACLYTENVE